MPNDQFTWSPAEKKLARKAFTQAYEAQCSAIIGSVKLMIAKASSPQDLWQVHDYLSEQREETDQLFDYRYSVLVSVFAELLRQGWLKEGD